MGITRFDGLILNVLIDPDYQVNDELVGIFDLWYDHYDSEHAGFICEYYSKELRKVIRVIEV